MDPLLIAQLALGIGSALAEAYQRHQAAQTALAAMLEENRGPTKDELEALRAAGADVDARLADLLG